MYQTEEGAISNADRLLVLTEERRDGQKNWDDANDSKLKGLVGYLIGTNWLLILHAKNTVAWKNVLGTMVTVTVFSAL